MDSFFDLNRSYVLRLYFHSKFFNLYYKGFTTDISLILEYHNSGKSTYTSKTDDWVLVYCDQFETKREALIEEKRLKKLNKASIEKIISHYTPI